MAISEKRLKALGASLRAELTLDIAMPAEIQSVVLRMARAQVERLPVPHRASA